MKSKQVKNVVFVRLERGEEIISQLEIVVKKYGIKLAKISGIGACDQVYLGIYNADRNGYIKKTFNGKFEVTSLIGNISEMNSEPYFHLHITLGDENMQVIGGHLYSGRIIATAEIIIEIYEGQIERFFDEETGLNLWQI